VHVHVRPDSPSHLDYLGFELEVDLSALHDPLDDEHSNH
jgi:hypothetical protein